MARSVIFLDFETFDLDSASASQKTQKMGGVAIALPKKMVITNRPNVATVGDTEQTCATFARVSRA